MAGRPKQTIRVYNPDGSLHNKYPSIVAFAKDNGVENNHISNYGYKNIGALKNGRIFSVKAIGREAVKDYVRIQKSPFVMKNKTKGTPVVDVYNLENEHIITFKNDYMARVIFPTLSYGTKGKKNAGLRFEKRVADF